ncbi:MAG TPA: Asp-tRNA(Asn)/Glu-tRNA(Gln) amidotransferase GatCAB subunit B, partial [Firmicutes bacterium]|nr:Asp-tRNA(Asn)/Glu-tRNA(Gln) amidotransferase GatCAB subunit B [Bacillota bacterium]
MEFVKKAIDTCPELYDEKMERYLKGGLSKTDAEIILSNPDMASYFEKGMNKVKNCKDFANFMIVEINSYLNKNGLKITDLKLKAETLAEIVLKQETGGLSHKQCADILATVLLE